VRILIETSGGGGIVLVVVVALLAGGHGGGLDAALAATLIALAVVVALALGGLVAFLLYRARQDKRLQGETATPLSVSAVRTPPRGGQFLTAGADTRPALELAAPREVRLHPEQLAELAEILRRHERPE
jgi:hypothetical protein